MTTPIEIVYLRKYNQYYKVLEYDEEQKIYYIAITKNKVNVPKSKILKIENDEIAYVIMRNRYVTAEQNFVQAMDCVGNYKRKLHEIHDFKRNGLYNSELVMNKVLELYHMDRQIKSDEERKFIVAIKSLYNSLYIQEDRRALARTYRQKVPKEILEQAEAKGLTVERVDEYINVNGSRRKTTPKDRQIIHKHKSCGYLIRNSTGKTIAGFGYSFTDLQVVQFVQHYVSKGELMMRIFGKNEVLNYVRDTDRTYQVVGYLSEENKLILNPVDMENAGSPKIVSLDELSERYNIGFTRADANKESPLEWFVRTSSSESDSLRRRAAGFQSIVSAGLENNSFVIRKLKRMALCDNSHAVRSKAYNTLHRLKQQNA